MDAPGHGEKPFSEETARVVDAEVQRIIRECHDDAKRLLQKNRKALDALVEALLEREALGEQEILEVTLLPPAPALENKRLAEAEARRRSRGAPEKEPEKLV